MSKHTSARIAWKNNKQKNKTPKQNFFQKTTQFFANFILEREQMTDLTLTLTGTTFMKLMYLMKKTTMEVSGYGLSKKDNLFYILAGLLLLQGILNISLCGAAGCASRGDRQKKVYEFKKYKPEK